MWFGIIIFGVANGFILLPVLLSLCGPLNNHKKMENVTSNDQGDVELKKVDNEPINEMMEGGRISLSYN